MKSIALTIIFLPAVFLAGCASYSRIESVHIGMSLEDVMALQSPCYYRGQDGISTAYGCDFEVPSGSGRTIKPYILTFNYGRLVDISIDERQLDREAMRDSYYDPHFRSGFFYHHYRH